MPKAQSHRFRCLQYLIRLLMRLLLGAACGAGVFWTAGEISYPIVVTQIPRTDGETAVDAAVATRHPGMAAYKQARLVVVTPDEEVRDAAPGFAAACDPDVSFDGRRIIFAGKRHPGDSWALWETDWERGTPRQVFGGEVECRHPIYLSSLFTIDSPEPWYTVMFAGRAAATGGGFNLCSVKLDGGEFRRITHHPGSGIEPFQMRDSRVVYSAWQESLNDFLRPSPRLGLFEINLDGTDLQLLTAEPGPAIRHMACVTSDDRYIVFIEAEEPAWDGAGRLAAVTRQRPHHSYQIWNNDPAYLFLNPSPAPENRLLVSRRPRAGTATSGVFLYDVPTGRMESVFDDPEFHDVQAHILQPRPMPDGRSTVVNPDFDTGLLYGLNAYDADPHLRPYLRQGIIQKLRIIEGVPDGGPVPRERILGQAPVEEDGSFQVEIPADTPMKLQLLDADGLALATCGWIWVKQRERRGCIGCHEDPELTPENRFVLAVRRDANTLAPPLERRRSLGFLEDVFPILQRSCSTAECHADSVAPWQHIRSIETADLEAARTAYHLLLGTPRGDPKASPYITPGHSRTSRLVWHLLGRDTRRPWDRVAASQAGEDSPSMKKMPSPEAATLSPAEVQTLIEWIDLGAQWTRTSLQP